MFTAKFQTFDEKSEGASGATRVAKLRTVIKNLDLQGFLVPRADEHQGEYVPASEERLAWLTGFTGSAGLAVILLDKAGLFIDGRYTVQASQQSDAAVFDYVPVPDVTISGWIAENCHEGDRIGYDPALHTAGEIARLSEALKRRHITLEAITENPVDTIWHDRPARPLAPVSLHPLAFAGTSAAEKIAAVQKSLKAEGLDALLVSDPHNLAWLFNIRGDDVSYTPIALGYALVPHDGRPVLIIAPKKLSADVSAALNLIADIAPEKTLKKGLKAYAENRRIRLDQATAGIRFSHWISKAKGVADVGSDPITLMKACKNTAEKAGTRAAHIRDGAAMSRFLCWFDAHAAKGNLTEIDAVSALEHFRRETGKLKNLSFPSISGANPHAAMPHYRVSTQSNRKIESGIFLIDSGGQYEDGTTDITRTIAVGTPSPQMRDRNTRVLKGMIAISRAVFPKGTSGAQLDTLARCALWEVGLDFSHGTGHGVGSYLSVHEGPQRLAKTGTVALESGMILSNEPGYYKEGAYGIRIENLVLVEERNIQGGERPMLGFETLTFAPIDKRLIEKSLLTQQEVDWFNAYHAEVWTKLSPLVDAETADWLRTATSPL